MFIILIGRHYHGLNNSNIFIFIPVIIKDCCYQNQEIYLLGSITIVISISYHNHNCLQHLDNGIIVTIFIMAISYHNHYH